LTEKEWNPYEAPAAPEATEGEDVLPKTPVLLVLFFTIITCGIYQPFWFWRRREVLNRMAPDKGVTGLCIAAFVSLGVVFVVGFLAGMASEGAPLAPQVDLFLQMLNLGYAILILILGFRVKGILEMNYSDSISGVGVFFLNIYYLQYKINRLGQGEGHLIGLGLTS
jgi:hypothetical protein